MSNMTAKIEGLDVVFGNLEKIKPAKLNVFIRKGLEKAARVVVNAVKAGIQPGGRGYETGALRKSIGFKVGTNKLGRSFAVVGAKRAMKRQKGKASTPTKFGSKLKGRQVGRDPANYAHLIEYGHRMASGGTLKPTTKPGWTPELVWNAKLKTLVYKHGAPRRMTKSKRTGAEGGGTSVGQVMGIGFMRHAYDSTQAAVQAIVKEHLAQAIDKYAATFPKK